MPDLTPKPDAWLHWHLDKDDSPPPLFRPVLLRGLQLLNQLPRSDPFWRSTNGEPTVHKLGEFCERLIQQEPDNDEPRLIHAALRMWRGAAPLAHLRPWMEKDPATRVEWVLQGCKHAFRTGGRDVVEEVRPLVEEFLPTLQDPVLSHARRFLAGEIPW